MDLRLIAIENDSELHVIANRLLNILVNLREAEKNWDKYGGPAAMQDVIHWEQQADTYLVELGSLDLKIPEGNANV